MSKCLIQTYTYKDYLAYDEYERIEIIEGEIINISPTPSRIHQEIIMEISYKTKQYIEINILNKNKHSEHKDFLFTMFINLLFTPNKYNLQNYTMLQLN